MVEFDPALLEPVPPPLYRVVGCLDSLAGHLSLLVQMGLLDYDAAQARYEEVRADLLD